MGIFGNSKMKLFIGSDKVKKAYLGTEKIYSAGNIVTYYVDSGTFYREEVDSGASCLEPTTFTTPTKDGWEFVGWREDTVASGDVLGSKIMGDEPITLYAVFKQSVTLYYYNGSTTKSNTSGNRYYNNGNTVNPSFTITQTSKSGWTARGWTTGTSANAMVSYSSINDTSFSANTTVYGLYYKTCTLTAKSYNSTQTAQGTAYYNSAGNTTNATCTVPTGASYSGWTWRGWSAASTTGASASVSYANGETYTLGTSDATIYGLYYQTIYLYYNGNGASSGSVSTQSGTRYYNAYDNTSNPTFTLASNGYSRNGYTFTGWDLGAVGETVTLSSSTTAYAQWSDNSFYGITNGSVNRTYLPDAYGFCNMGHSTSSGTVSANGYTFLGGGGHTNGETESAGADTGAFSTHGCKNLYLETHKNPWATITVYGDDSVIYNETKYVSVDETYINSITLNISSYSNVRVHVSYTAYEGDDNWFNIGIVNLRLYN